MEHIVTLREMNQNFPKYVKEAEQGITVVITRRGKPVVMMTMVEEHAKESIDMNPAWERTLARVRSGVFSGLSPFDREDAHER